MPNSLRKSPAGTYEIIDLGSHHGTFVNDKRVSRATVTDQDIITIGHSTFRHVSSKRRPARANSPSRYTGTGASVRRWDGTRGFRIGIGPVVGGARTVSLDAEEHARQRLHKGS